MALTFGPQWLRDLSDGGVGSPQPSTPTMSVKFKLADYRYGREEMLCLFNDNSPPPDQVRKHLSIFSKDIQKPISLSPLTEEEQRLISQGFNSVVVLRAAGRGSGPSLRARGGGTVERGRGRGRGRGEGYIIRPENGDVAYSRPTQDGWEHVGRKFERSYSRGYDESGFTKREFSRSSSDNWRDKRHDDEEEDDGGVGWRNTREQPNARWGPSSRQNWREPQRGDALSFEGDRRPPPPRRGFDQESQLPHRTSESYDNDGEVPEWVEDDVGDDPGTFDSSGAFVSTKEGRKYSDKKPEAPNIEDSEKKLGNHHPSQMKEQPVSTTPEPLSNYNMSDKTSIPQSTDSIYIPPNARNGTGDAVDSRQLIEQHHLPPGNSKGQIDSYMLPMSTNSVGNSCNNGDTGFAYPNKQETNGTCAPPGQLSNTPTLVSHPHNVTSQKSDPGTRKRLTDPNFLHMEKSLQNLVASLAVDYRDGRQVDISQGALPLTHENSNKWFYKDPQGEIQGPFTNEEMSQWFSAGFFTMSLVIKRGCDDSFKQLGELIKRYGRVPFLPGPPLPPLITSIEPSPVPTPPLVIPSLGTPTSVTPQVGPGLPAVPDPLILQHMLLHQEYLKQTYLMRMQIHTMHQLQEQDSFKSLPPEQQLHFSREMSMQAANPVFVQQLQQLQQLQLQQEQQKVQQPLVVPDNSTAPVSQPTPNNTTPTTTPTATNNISGTNSNKTGDDGSAWGVIQQYITPGMWSQPSPPPIVQPTSLWDIDTSSGTISPAYLAQISKIKNERKDEKAMEEKRLSQDELEKKQEEIRRQQEELERQRSQMKKDREELERQRQIELQKIEEARRQEEERALQEMERKLQKKVEEKKKAEQEKKRQEEERKRENELKKQEEKKRKDEEKRMQEAEKRLLAEYRKEKEQEMLRQQELQQREMELMRQQELALLQEAQRVQKEEDERIQREAAERERLEALKRQQYELQRQQESQRRLQQSQRDQLANIQLPATSNWATQQQNIQVSPSQSLSLTEIQEEEARQELERELELQQQTQRMQEQVYLKNIQQQQKSWAVQASQGMSNKGVSLLDIQQQEQESAKRSQKDKPNNQTYQAKLQLSLASASTWTGSTSGSSWNNQLGWNSSMSNTPGIWDQVPNTSNKKSAIKESGEFPALKNQSQTVKKNNEKSTKTKYSGSKQKKEEESVQKLFQTRQQDDFSNWVMENVSRFCAPIDVPTFVSFIVEVDSPDDVREYMKTYLGDTKESRDFSRQFVEKRNYFRNQARLEKQQEEDSIWGPAPAVNPHNQIRGSGGVIIGGSGGGGIGGNNNSLANDGTDGGTGKNKNRKKKQKMQKLDGSILGFTVHADPNRKNAAGEVESIQ